MIGMDLVTGPASLVSEWSYAAGTQSWSADLTASGSDTIVTTGANIPVNCRLALQMKWDISPGDCLILLILMVMIAPFSIAR